MNYVAIGCDSNQEWMLPWWHDNFTYYNPNIPVVFGDFGMTKPARSWCSDRGQVVSVTKDPDDQRCTWFQKPAFFSSLSADARFNNATILYMDNDCEVRGPVDDLFQYCANVSDVALRHDIITNFNHHMNRNGYRPIQTGVMVFKTGNEIIDKWSAVSSRDTHHRGDQEILDTIFYERHQQGDATTKINTFPDRFNQLRLEGEKDDTVIMHWTGPVGTDVIRSKMNRQSQKPPLFRLSQPSSTNYFVS